MKLSLHIDRGHYKVSMEFAEEDAEGLEDQIPEALLELDKAIKAASGLWNVRVHESDRITILPSGFVRFHNAVISGIDQLVLLTGLGGTGGVTVEEASEMLAMPYDTISSRFTGENYRNLFRKIEEGRYALSKEGIKRRNSILSEKTERENEENEG